MFKVCIITNNRKEMVLCVNIVHRKDRIKLYTEASSEEFKDSGDGIFKNRHNAELQELIVDGESIFKHKKDNLIEELEKRKNAMIEEIAKNTFMLEKEHKERQIGQAISFEFHERCKRNDELRARVDEILNTLKLLVENSDRMNGYIGFAKKEHNIEMPCAMPKRTWERD